MARTCILRAFGLQMSWCFLWCYVCFVLLCFVSRLYAFVEAAALRSIVLRYAGVPIATRVSFFSFFSFFCLFGMSLFPSTFFVPFPLSLCMDYRVRRTFFPSGWCFFYLVTTGWIFDISLYENSINQSTMSRCTATPSSNPGENVGVNQGNGRIPLELRAG